MKQNSKKQSVFITALNVSILFPGYLFSIIYCKPDIQFNLIETWKLWVYMYLVYVPVVTHKWLKTNKNHVCRPALKKGKIGTMRFILFFFHLIFL